jgi:antibiotic biosynthesis monooxygenase (ABM) superfamily enzyme
MIKVIIERSVAEGLEAYYEKAIGDLLTVMTEFAGYVSGESLVEIHRPNRYVVVSQWLSESAWDRWYISNQRQQLVTTLAPFLESEETYTKLQRLVYHADERIN